ncbi:unnamed protein product [Strongylus vulgaris]|uniref:Uncharacterized protein n=1 Tax=Strongylus vulgaris TaxID=40348 RepID=A0A3P7J2M2_STRVU|nr:unnamed protein product [Strongylus vulgaris]
MLFLPRCGIKDDALEFCSRKEVLLVMLFGAFSYVHLFYDVFGCWSRIFNRAMERLSRYYFISGTKQHIIIFEKLHHTNRECGLNVSNFHHMVNLISAPYWLWFSTGEFVMVQLMVGSFFLILHRMSRISAAPNIRDSQRHQLFSLFWTFETSALADLGYHMSLFYLADDRKGCSGVFNHDQLRYSLLKFPYDIVSFLLPVWAILYVFRTTRKPNIYNDDSTESIYASRGSSIGSIADVVVVRNWRRRYRPLTQVGSNYV